MRYSATLVVSYLPTLVIDADGASGQLAEQLRYSGFVTDIAFGRTAAIAAVRAGYYGSIVFVGDLCRPADLHCIAKLRRRMPRTWIIAISSGVPHDTRELFLNPGVDTLLVRPFAMKDLTSRLFAFSLRSRPP